MRVNNGSQIKVGPIDDVMAGLSWEVSRLAETFNKKEKVFLQSVLDKYQLYVITKPSYRNKDQGRRVSGLIRQIGDPNLSMPGAARVHNATKSSLQNDFRLIAGGSMGLEKVPLRPKTVRLYGGADGEDEFYDPADAPLIQADVLQQLPRKSEREELLGKTILEQGDRLQRMEDMMELMHRRQMESQEAVFNAFQQAQVDNTHTDLDHLRLLQVDKRTAKLEKDVDMLVDLALRKEPVSGVPWERLGPWMKDKWRQGIMRTAIGAAGIPFTAVRAVVDEVVVNQFLYATNWWLNKVRLVAGTVWIVVVIAGVTNIIVADDYAFVKNFHSTYGGNLVKSVAIDPAVWASNWLASYVPHVLRDFGPTMYKLAWDAVDTAMRWAMQLGGLMLSWVRLAIAEAAKQIPGVGRFF